MNWLWIPAVVLVSLFVVVLCWLFFKDYTCCPCRRKRSQEPVLPTHHTSSFLPPDEYQPSAPPQCPITPRGSPHLQLTHADLPVRQVFRLEQGIPTVDLHCMTVREATQIVDAFLAQNRGRHHRVRIVTGRGLHSENGVPKVKPAVLQLLENQNLKFCQVHNGGCLEVVLPKSALY